MQPMKTAASSKANKLSLKIRFIDSLHRIISPAEIVNIRGRFAHQTRSPVNYGLLPSSIDIAQFGQEWEDNIVVDFWKFTNLQP